jgi:trehalose 6-phosphate phosphatase
MTAEALAALRADPGSAGVFVDFDGTLADIVPDPKLAAPVDGAVEVLSALASVFAVVALVSGRRAVGLAERLGRLPGVRYYGLYGLEDLDGPLDPEAHQALRTMNRLLPELERLAAAVPGARVEPKGYHASVHYRAASDPKAARETLLRSVGEAIEGTGMRLLEGKRVVEVAPAHGPSKGDVLRRVAADERLRGILYAGDDVADLEAYIAVDELRRSGLAGVSIAVRTTDGREEVLGAADLIVEGPGALVELLRGLLSPR